jgi:hypothetical protein
MAALIALLGAEATTLLSAFFKDADKEFGAFCPKHHPAGCFPHFADAGHAKVMLNRAGRSDIRRDQTPLQPNADYASKWISPRWAVSEDVFRPALLA